MNDKDLLYELTESKRIIEEELGHKITTICYPYGAVNARVIKFALLAGYTAGYATNYSAPYSVMNQYRSTVDAAMARRRMLYK